MEHQPLGLGNHLQSNYAMSSARWTSADLKRFQGRKLEAKIKRRPKPKAADKTTLLFTRLCEVYGLPAPMPEYRFHPARKWRIDYYFEANGRRVALEVEGGIWTQGRHTRGSGFKRDMEKYNAITAAGIMLLRTTPKDLLTSQTFELIKKTLWP